MIKKQDFLTFPFTEKNLNKFKKEMIKAGSFDELMFQKKALKGKTGMKLICIYKDIDQYRNKFLKGGYENLKPFYDTEVPYIFWSNLHEKLINHTGERI